MKVEAPYPEHSSAPAKPRRRKQLKAYNVLGDVDEYESMLRAVEEPRTPTPETPAVFDVSNVPPEVMDAMQLDETLYQPILGAFHELVAERLALQQEYSRVSASEAETAQQFQQQSLALSEDTRDSRILTKHKDYEEKWAIQAVHLASRLGKQPEDVALSRAFKFRKRREKLDHLHKSKPVSERLPGHLYWQVSLRNCHSRFIQVGNEFNGLFTEAKEKPSELLDVPLEIFGKPKAMDPTRGTTANLLIDALGLRRRRLLRTQEEKGRAWLQGEYLTETVQRYEKLMAKMMAHTPETDELCVIGKSEKDALKQRAEAPITLKHVISRLSQKHPEAHTRYEEAASARKQQDMERAAAALQEAEEALQLDQDRSGPAGPAVRLSATRLVLTATVGYTASAKLTVRAVGTAAIRFYWTRSVQKCSLPGLPASDKENNGSCVDFRNQITDFYMYNATGCIMPGEEKTFEFMWKPTREGMFTEAWQLCTFPQCVPGFEPPQVVLRGTGVKHDSDSLLRKRIEQGLSHATSRRESALAIERVLRDLTVPPTRPQKIPEALVKDHNLFAAAAASGVPVFRASANGENAENRRPLFWNEGLGTRVHAAFDQLRELVTPVRQETPPGAKKKGKHAEAPEIVPAELLAAVQEWSGSIQDLLSLSEQVKGNVSNPELSEKAAAIVAEINTVIAEAELPALRTVINFHAIRCIVERAATALERAGDSARASAEMAFAQRQVAAGKDPEAEAKNVAETPPAAAGKKGKAMVKEKEPEKYDVEEYKSLLEAGFQSALKKSLNDTERVMEDTVQHVGKVVDRRIDRVQNQLKAAVAKGDSAAEEQKSWELFAWLRKREHFGIQEPPADLAVKAAPIRNEPLNFGEKLTIRRPKPAAEHVGSSMESEKSPDGDVPENGVEHDGADPQDATAAHETEGCNYNLPVSKEGDIPGIHADDLQPQRSTMDAI